MTPAEHLKQLVAIDSTSTLSNAPMIELLEQKLRAKGLRTSRHAYVDAKGVQKQNLVARAGPDGDPQLALVGHTDCVPYDASWKEALILTPKDGKLYARGACDTKGFIACALHAVESTDLGSLRAPLAMIFTADEEVGCIGAKELADAKPFQVKYAIVGEPTQLQPVRANKGYCLGEIEIRGKEGHSAYPEKGASAIRAAGRVLAALDGLDGELRALPDPAFAPPFTTLNVGLISGGKAKNIIPGSCKLTLEWRPVPSQDARLVVKRVLDILKQVCSAEPGLDYTFDPGRLDLGFATVPTSEIVKFVEREVNQKPGTVAFGTEGPQLTDLGAEVVVFGPGDIRVAHQTGEFVPEADLAECTRVLQKAVKQFCG
ncbi:MAG: acetylornithine deacetylase [Deltaproteobacteria bacterium]|nr:acetylornithine deacetylase [Deltaproteobacteria bacterium]